MNKKEKLLNAITNANAETLKDYLIDMVKETIEEDDIIEGLHNGCEYEIGSDKLIEDYFTNGLMIDTHAIMGEE